MMEDIGRVVVNLAFSIIFGYTGGWLAGFIIFSLLTGLMVVAGAVSPTWSVLIIFLWIFYGVYTKHGEKGTI